MYVEFLSREEFNKELKKFRKGDQAALEKIINSHRPYVVKMANKCHRLWSDQYSNDWCSQLDVEDLIQAGCVGLMNALENFDPNKNTGFLTYAHWSVLKEMQMVLKDRLFVRAMNCGAVKFRAKSIHSIDEQSALIPDRSLKENDNEVLELLLKCCTLEDRKIVCMKLGINFEARAFVRIAKQLKMQPRAVLRRFNRTLENLKEKLKA